MVTPPKALGIFDVSDSIEESAEAIQKRAQKALMSNPPTLPPTRFQTNFFYGIRSLIFYALGFAAFSYALGLVFHFTGSVLSEATLFGRPLIGVGRAIIKFGEGCKFVGKLIPGLFAFAIESFFYTIPKWLVTKAIPKLFDLAQSFFGWIGKNAINLVEFCFRKALTVLEVCLQKLSSLGLQVAQFIQEYFVVPVLNFTQKMANLILEYAIQPLIRLVNTVIQGVQWVVETVITPILQTAMRCIKMIEEAGTWIIQTILKPVVDTVKNLITAAANLVWNVVNSVLRNFVYPVLETAWNLITKTANIVWNGVEFIDCKENHDYCF